MRQRMSKSNIQRLHLHLQTNKWVAHSWLDRTGVLAATSSCLRVHLDHNTLLEGTSLVAGLALPMFQPIQCTTPISLEDRIALLSTLVAHSIRTGLVEAFTLAESRTKDLGELGLLQVCMVAPTDLVAYRDTTLSLAHLSVEASHLIKRGQMHPQLS